jgi:hypothetical protein
VPGTPEGLPAVSDLINLGEQFFLREMAMAVAGAMLEINAFDQPNVQKSKDYTKKYLETFTRWHPARFHALAERGRCEGVFTTRTLPFPKE